MAYSFAFLENYSRDLQAGKSVPRLHRHPDVEAQYTLHKQQHNDLAAHIQKTYLSDCDCKLVENKFPLHLEPNIIQYVMWFKTHYPTANMYNTLCELFTPHRIVMFENPYDWKSIPDIVHVHVFVAKA